MTLQLPGRTARGVTTRLVSSCLTFSPLPLWREAVIFFCVSPAVTDSLQINKRDALCCPDFPHTPRGASDRPSNCFLGCKISASRAKCQIYLCISEAQPNLNNIVVKDTTSREENKIKLFIFLFRGVVYLQRRSC